LVSSDTAAYLPEENNQEMMAVKIINGRRGVLKTLALTMATGAISLASAGARTAAAAVESALTPPGATHLDVLMKRLAQAPRRRDSRPYR
jgi:hypothetical protein